MQWLKNVSNAIEYIENNLNKTISYDEAARIACCSTYYFQRMFTYIVGITLAEYIRRRRMTQAAFELQRTNKKVLDVAMEYGYSSPTAFNRSFQSVHGVTPISAKQNGALLNVYPPLRFSVEVSGSKAMTYQIEAKPAMRIVGIRTPLQEDMEANHKNIPLFWKRAIRGKKIPKIMQLMNATPSKILGISVYENAENFHYYIATQSDAQPQKGMYAYEIPAATWVVFKNEGHFKTSVQCLFQRFYKEWLLFSGYEYANLPDIEVYPIVDDKTKSGDFEVWIAIRKEKEE